MRILYLPYEIRSREFVTYQYLANEIIESGAVDQVLIGPREILQKVALLGLLKPGIWYLKGASCYIENILKRLKKLKYKLLLHDAESICTFELNGQQDCFMKPPSTLSFVDSVLTSSKSETNTIRLLNPNLDVRETGFLRFEYLSNLDFVKDIYKKEIKSIKKSYGKYIYIILSGTCSKFSELKDFATEMNNYKLYKMQDWRIDIQKKWIDVSHLCFFTLLDSIRLLLTQEENIKVVIRPHPSEDKKFLSKLFIGFENVLLDNNYSLHAAILGASKVIVSPVSTTSFECAILRKEAYCLLPNLYNFNNQIINTHITNSLVTISKDAKDLISKILSKDTLSESEFNKRKSLALNYARINNKSLNVLINLIYEFSTFFPKKNKHLKKISSIRKFILLSAASAYKFLGRFFKRIKYANHKLKGNFKIPKEITSKKYPKNNNYEFGSFLIVSRK